VTPKNRFKNVLKWPYDNPASESVVGTCSDEKDKKNFLLVSPFCEIMLMKNENGSLIKSEILFHYKYLNKNIRMKGSHKETYRLKKMHENNVNLSYFLC